MGISINPSSPSSPAPSDNPPTSSVFGSTSTTTDSTSSSFLISGSGPSVSFFSSIPTLPDVDLMTYVSTIGTAQTAFSEQNKRFDAASVSMMKPFYRHLLEMGKLSSSAMLVLQTYYNKWTNMVALINSQVTSLQPSIDNYNLVQQLADQQAVTNLNSAIAQFNLDGLQAPLAAAITAYNSYFTTSNTATATYNTAATTFNAEVITNNNKITNINDLGATLGLPPLIPYELPVALLLQQPLYPVAPSYTQPLLPVVLAQTSLLSSPALYPPPPPINTLPITQSPVSGSAGAPLMTDLQGTRTTIENTDRYIRFSVFKLRGTVPQQSDAYIYQKPGPRGGGSGGTFGTGLGSTLTGLQSSGLDGAVGAAIYEAMISDTGAPLPPAAATDLRASVVLVTQQILQQTALLSAATLAQRDGDLLSKLRPGNSLEPILFANEFGNNLLQVAQSDLIPQIASQLIAGLPNAESIPADQKTALEGAFASILKANLQLSGIEQLSISLNAPGLVAQVVAAAMPEASQLLGPPTQAGALNAELTSNAPLLDSLKGTLVDALGAALNLTHAQVLPAVEAAVNQAVAAGPVGNLAELANRIISALTGTITPPPGGVSGQVGGAPIAGGIPLPAALSALLGGNLGQAIKEGVTANQLLSDKGVVALLGAAGSNPAIASMLQTHLPQLLGDRTIQTVGQLRDALVTLLVQAGVSLPAALSLASAIASASGLQPIQPPVVGQQPPVVGQQPPVVGQQPPVVGQQPPIVGQQPPIVGQQPPVVGQQPSVVGQQPPVVGQQPPVVGQQLIGVQLQALLASIQLPGVDLRALIPTQSINPVALQAAIPQLIVGTSLEGHIPPILPALLQQLPQQLPPTTTPREISDLVSRVLVANQVPLSDAILIGLRIAALVGQSVAAQSPLPQSQLSPLPMVDLQVVVSTLAKAFPVLLAGTDTSVTAPLLQTILPQILQSGQVSTVTQLSDAINAALVANGVTAFDAQLVAARVAVVASNVSSPLLASPVPRSVDIGLLLTRESRLEPLPGVDRNVVEPLLRELLPRLLTSAFSGAQLRDTLITSLVGRSLSLTDATAVADRVVQLIANQSAIEPIPVQPLTALPAIPPTTPIDLKSIDVASIQNLLPSLTVGTDTSVTAVQLPLALLGVLQAPDITTAGQLGNALLAALLSRGVTAADATMISLRAVALLSSPSIRGVVVPEPIVLPSVVPWVTSMTTPTTLTRVQGISPPVALSADVAQQIALNLSLFLVNALPLSDVRGTDLNAPASIGLLQPTTFIESAAGVRVLSGFEQPTADAFKATLSDVLQQGNFNTVRDVRDLVISGLVSRGVALQDALTLGNRFVGELVRARTVQGDVVEVALKDQALQSSLESTLIQQAGITPEQALEISTGIADQLASTTQRIDNETSLRSFVRDALVSSFGLRSDLAQQISVQVPLPQPQTPETVFTSVGVVPQNTATTIPEQFNEFLLGKFVALHLDQLKAQDVASALTSLVFGPPVTLNQIEVHDISQPMSMVRIISDSIINLKETKSVAALTQLANNFSKRLMPSTDVYTFQTMLLDPALLLVHSRFTSIQQDRKDPRDTSFKASIDIIV